jgi:hypothetical protein
MYLIQRSVQSNRFQNPSTTQHLSNFINSKLYSQHGPLHLRFFRFPGSTHQSRLCSRPSLRSAERSFLGSSGPPHVWPYGERLRQSGRHDRGYVQYVSPFFVIFIFFIFQMQIDQCGHLSPTHFFVLLSFLVLPCPTIVLDRFPCGCIFLIFDTDSELKENVVDCGLIVRLQ